MVKHGHGLLELYIDGVSISLSFDYSAAGPNNGTDVSHAVSDQTLDTINIGASRDNYTDGNPRSIIDNFKIYKSGPSSWVLLLETLTHSIQF